MKVNRKHIIIKNIDKNPDCYVDTTPQERISFIWELTAEIWSLKDSHIAERRLQRNVAKLIKQQG